MKISAIVYYTFAEFVIIIFMRRFFKPVINGSLKLGFTMA